MVRRLIVDTGVLIASERGRQALRTTVDEDDDLVIAAITVAELRTGIELAGDQHRTARTEFLLSVLEVMPVEPYDLATAEAHGRLLAHVHRTGTTRGAHDLIIAATAVATKRIILTSDRKAHFDDLPGVESLVIGSTGVDGP
ncbi:MAG TPA: PIN domain-containing protein [Lacisediminihabitans sp.]|uniref:PIN domain-containing protein n=1 Tax=Lacisediminihabitans sp. TaxID=2787631 RepID=UPI002ED7AC36